MHPSAMVSAGRAAEVPECSLIKHPAANDLKANHLEAARIAPHPYDRRAARAARMPSPKQASASSPTPTIAAERPFEGVASASRTSSLSATAEHDHRADTLRLHDQEHDQPARRLDRLCRLPRSARAPTATVIDDSLY
jgi:hypothetical protein